VPAELRASPRDRARLQAFERLLRAQGFPTNVVLESPDVPYDVLLVGLGDAEETRHWQLELSIVPGMEEDQEGAALLQCFAPLPAEVPPGAEDELRRLIVRLNTRIPVVGFGYLDAERVPCFRHVAMLPRDDGAAGEVVVQLAWMTGYLLGVFAPTIEAVASGAQTFEEALADNVFSEVFK
jgi:hypothetical protein